MSQETQVFIAMALLLVVPREDVLGLGFASRLLWTIFMVPLPVFFACIIFSTTFGDSAALSAAFGANLFDAKIGGFCECLAIGTGNLGLSMLVIVAYMGSMIVISSVKRLGLAL